MAGIVLSPGIATITKKVKVPALMKHVVRWEKTNNKHTNKQVNEMVPHRDNALEIK